MISPVQAAVGIIVALLAVGALLYTFYSRTNSVEKTGYGALMMLSIISLMIPIFWIVESNGETISQLQQHNTAVNRGASLFAQYCFQCHGIFGQGVVGPKLNGNTAVNNLSDSDILRIISGGIYDPANPTTALMPAWSDQFGGPLTEDQIQYLFQLIRSADPAYLSKNGFPTGPGTNGFDQVPGLVQQSQPIPYSTAIAQATAGSGIGQFPFVDLTSRPSIIIQIIDSPTGAACNPACYAVADPKNASQLIIDPNIKVKVGTKITWINKSKTIHTVTSLVGEVPTVQVPAKVFDSGLTTPMAAGTGVYSYTVATQAYTFNSNHIVVYYCQFHPSMVAAITVTQ
ncbi:MAG TPA: c-type cytochrome [Ktedonobacteraceae bacterium]|nr:c-type cytochrome [Ktedonobacteraceae bacterium]